MQEKTIYTAKDGERITSVKTIDNSIVITIEPEKKTWLDYAKDMDYDISNGIETFCLPSLFNIALHIMKDLNGDWKAEWSDYNNKYYVIICRYGNEIEIEGYASMQLCPLAFKSKEAAQQFLDICGKEFIFKLYGRA